jgi:hypothetical protein
MMTANTPLRAKVCCGLSIALLALSFSSGVSTVRAESEALAPSWREMIVNPIMDAVQAVESRLSTLEATVASYAESFTSRQINAREICISDDSGAKTCITKMQLDAVLKTMAQAAAIEPPAQLTEAKPAAEPAPLEAAAIEPAPLEPAAAEPTTVVTAPAIEPVIEQPVTVTVTEAKPAAPAAEPAEIETIATVAAPAPAAMPAQAALADENLPLGEEPLHTGSVSAPASRPATVWQPEVEVSVPAPVPSEE